MFQSPLVRVAGVEPASNQLPHYNGPLIRREGYTRILTFLTAIFCTLSKSGDPRGDRTLRYRIENPAFYH